MRCVLSLPNERVREIAKKEKSKYTKSTRNDTNETNFIFKFDPSAYYCRYRSGRSGHSLAIVADVVFVAL